MQYLLVKWSKMVGYIRMVCTINAIMAMITFLLMKKREKLLLMNVSNGHLSFQAQMTVLDGKTQMSDKWIDDVADRLEDAGNVEVANAVRTAKQQGKLTKTVTAIKKTNPGKGEIVTIKVD